GTSMIPRRATECGFCVLLSVIVTASLKILHLLAKLLDYASQFQPDICQLHVVRFRAQRICFTIELLSEEIEAAADRPALGNELSDLHDMGREPIEFLTYIGLARDQDRLLMQAIQIEPLGSVDDDRDLLGDTGLERLGPTARRR